ncbi:MAG TPA: hypothetical protein VIE36_14120 [Methylomirabilota bacterium]|jgi:hypothetical protein
MQTNKRQALIQHLIEVGQLPHRIDGVRMWGGPGTERPCATCGEPIVVSAVEYELDLGGRTLVLCVPCYVAWRAEPTGA